MIYIISMIKLIRNDALHIEFLRHDLCNESILSRVIMLLIYFVEYSLAP